MVSLHQRNTFIMIILFMLIGGFGYGTYSYSMRSIKKIETSYQEEQEFVEEIKIRQAHKAFLTAYEKQPIKGSERILPLEAQNANLFTHLGTLGELYDVLTADFQINILESGGNRSLPPHTKMTRITFDFIGSRYNVKEFISRLEEVTPLITIRDFSLSLDTTQATKGSLTIETYRFDYDSHESGSIITPIDPSSSTPESHKTYSSLYNLKESLVSGGPSQN